MLPPAVQISFQESRYDVAEDVGEVTICAEVVDGEGFRPNTSVELLAHTSSTSFDGGAGMMRYRS